MNFLTYFLLTLAAGAVSAWLLPWWAVALVAAVVGVAVNELSPFKSFWVGFLGIGVVWLTHAIWINSANGGQMLEKISQLLKMSHFLIWLLTFLIAGFLGGLGMLTGRLGKLAILGDSTGRRRRRR